jgi:hypothetical protein
VFFPFHNFDFAPGKDFVQKKPPRWRLREAVQRAGALEFTLQRGPNKLKLELQLKFHAGGGVRLCGEPATNQAPFRGEIFVEFASEIFPSSVRSGIFRLCWSSHFSVSATGTS